MPSHENGDHFARANGFESFLALLAASRHVPDHGGAERFMAVAPDGRRFLWAESDLEDLDHAVQRGMMESVIQSVTAAAVGRKSWCPS